MLQRFSESDKDFLYGRSIIDFIVQPIPRFLMSEKVYKTSAYITQTFFPIFSKTFTPEYGLISESFLNFGILGVAMGGGIFGFLIRINEFVVNKYSNNKSFLLFYMPIILTPLGWLLAGFNSDTSVMFLLNSFMGVLLLTLLCKREKAFPLKTF